MKLRCNSCKSDYELMEEGGGLPFWVCPDCMKGQAPTPATGTPYEKARAVFSTYAAMNAPDLPVNPLAGLQVLLTRWEVENFGAQKLLSGSGGITEEWGELLEAVLGMGLAASKISRSALKTSQGIYGDPEKLRKEAADAIADVAGFCLAACSTLRVDFCTLLFETMFQEVLPRNWRAHPTDGRTA